MRATDIAELLQTLASDVREFVSQTVAPIGAQQAALEQRVVTLAAEKAEPGPPGSPGEPGPAGASAFETARAAGFTGTEKEWLDTLRGPAGESIPGEPGADGASVTLEDLAPLVEQAVAALPPAKSLSVDDVRPLVKDLVDAAAAQIPVPKDGASVTLEDVAPLVERAVAEHAKAFGADDVNPIVDEQLRGFASALTAKFAGADHAG